MQFKSVQQALTDLAASDIDGRRQLTLKLALIAGMMSVAVCFLAFSSSDHQLLSVSLNRLVNNGVFSNPYAVVFNQYINFATVIDTASDKVIGVGDVVRQFQRQLC